jgi:hypothetical protein
LKDSIKTRGSIQILHQNVQSLSNKMQNFEVLLTEKSLQWDILCITEGKMKLIITILKSTPLFRNFVGKRNNMEVHAFMLKLI